MADRAASRSAAPTVMDALYQQNQITRKVVSFYLSYEFNTAGSQVIFGEPDWSHAPKGVTYSPLLGSSGMWVVQLQQLTFSGSDATNLPTMCQIDRKSGGTPCAALIDTGTSLIGIPYRLFLQFLASINSRRPDCKLDAVSSNSSPHNLFSHIKLLIAALIAGIVPGVCD